MTQTTKLYAWQRLVNKFKDNAGCLTTYDFAHDPSLACEYRRLLCDLERKGYHVMREKITPQLWNYVLYESADDGQLKLVA